MTSPSTDAVREVLVDTERYLGGKPEAGRGWSKPVLATWEGGVRCRVESGFSTGMRTDMSPKLEGKGDAHSPGLYFRATTAACVGTVIAQRAAVEGIALDRLEVTVESEGDARGMLGLDESMPAGPLDTMIRIAVAAKGVPAERLQELARWGEAHSPVSEMISRAVPKRVEIDVASV